MKTKTYDSKCYELAEYFLDEEDELNTDKMKRYLAAEIQDFIEGEIQSMRKSYYKEERS